MRTLFLVFLLCLSAQAAWAKTITISRGSINEYQLLDELTTRFPDWLPPKQPARTSTPVRFRAESNDREITLIVPDDADEAAIRAVIAAHVPRPQPQRLDYDALEAHVKQLEDKVQRLEATLRPDPSPSPSP